MKKISVVIPVYNGSEYLSKCLDSIIKQTYPNIEVIIVNDGSIDITPKICNDYSQEYENITTVHIKNGGVSKARNVGFTHVTGEYIIFIDSDDYLHPQMLEKLYINIEKYNADISICEAYSSLHLDNKYINEGSITILNKDSSLKEFLLSKKIKSGVWTKLFRKELLSDIYFKEGYRINEDKFFIFEALQKSETVVYCDLPLYCYVKRENSVTTDVFSNKWFDIHYFAKEINSIVHEKYPEYKNEAQYQLLMADYSLLNIMYTKNADFKCYKKEIQDIMVVINSIDIKKIKKYIKRNIYRNIYILQKNDKLYWFLKKIQKVWMRK